MNTSQSPKNSFEQLYGKPLTQQQVAEMKFNLSLYIESLAEMDKQHKEWLKQQDTADEKTDSSEVPPEVIN